MIVILYAALLAVAGATESCDGYMRKSVCMAEPDCGWKECLETQMGCPAIGPQNCNSEVSAAQLAQKQLSTCSITGEAFDRGRGVWPFRYLCGLGQFRCSEHWPSVDMRR